MISYELAKKLKEAGFPLKEKYSCKVCGYHPNNRSTWCELGCGSDYNEIIKITSWCPTLSELIEACGDRFSSLNHGIDGTYNAWATRMENTKYIDEIYGRGKTPDEAMTKLWLKLNE